MRARFIATLFLVAVTYSSDISVGANDGLGAADLNVKIEEAVAAGRQWPRYPGGLAGFLFGASAVVFGRAPDGLHIVAADTTRDARQVDVAIVRRESGTWAVKSVADCEQTMADSAASKRDRRRDFAIRRSGIDFSRQGPIELLEVLKTWPTPYWCAPLLPFGWVKESDVPALVKLLDSQERCANVMDLPSSYIDENWSTVGNEAAFLIDGFRSDHYPPRLNSTRPRSDKADIRKWWDERGGT